uniref:Cyclin-D-binding Myb-like transcription factor 1 n=1 Tax=Eptatretus burgeri TaxID=7764 RepID=A0A8C4NCY5_EPTBU
MHSKASQDRMLSLRICFLLNKGRLVAYIFFCCPSSGLASPAISPLCPTLSPPDHTRYTRNLYLFTLTVSQVNAHHIHSSPLFSDTSSQASVLKSFAPVQQLYYSLQPLGHKWKQGMWSKEETEILKANIDNFLKSNNIRDATEVIFETPKDERKDFYRSIARGLNRPLFAVYRRVLRLYDNRNHVGKYSSLEIKQLKELRMKHGNDWAAIGAALGRSASSVKDRCRLMKDTCNTGKWAVEEERRLASVVHEMTGTPPGTTVTQGVCWAEVAEQVRTRSEKQCRSKWLNYLNWKQSGGREWSKDDDVNLILRIAELQPSEESQISWEKLAAGWSSVRSPQWLHSKWWSLKRQVTNHQQLAFPVLCHFAVLVCGVLTRVLFAQSFHLQPMATLGTLLLQTSSSQSLPLTLAPGSSSALSAGASTGSQQILVHTIPVREEKIIHQSLFSVHHSITYLFCLILSILIFFSSTMHICMLFKYFNTFFAFVFKLYSFYNVLALPPPPQNPPHPYQFILSHLDDVSVLPLTTLNGNYANEYTLLFS